jgi:hypothetical protein
MCSPRTNPGEYEDRYLWGRCWSEKLLGELIVDDVHGPYQRLLDIVIEQPVQSRAREGHKRSCHEGSLALDGLAMNRPRAEQGRGTHFHVVEADVDLGPRAASGWVRLPAPKVREPADLWLYRGYLIETGG